VFSVPEPSVEVGDVLHASGMFFASNLHMDMGKTIGQSLRFDFLGFYIFGSSFASPSGQIHVRKTIKLLVQPSYS